MSSTDKIVIDLSKTHTTAFDEQNFIQRAAKRQFERKLTEFLAEVPEYLQTLNSGDELTRYRRHNTILINGQRGMGKTSFMLSVRENLAQELKEQLCILPLLDPTLLESREHVLINIIALINQEVKKAFKDQGFGITNRLQSQWKDSLSQLAGGLRVLDGVGNNPMKEGLWDSSELILEQGLSSAHHGYKLEVHFHQFLQQSLELLKKDAFLLMLDDIDTSVDQGFNILEVLRKYLTSPQLLVTVLGDIGLYSTIVRQLQWKKIDPHHVLKTYEDHNQYREQIEHLEEQYLTKLLKPENRIDLLSLSELLGQIEVDDGIELEPCSLKSYFDDYLQKVFLLGSSERHLSVYRDYFLDEPIRSVFQLLATCVNLEKKISPNQPTSNSKLYAHFPSAMKQVFYTTLKKGLEEYQLFEVGNPQTILSRIGLYLTKQDRGLDNLYKLLPESNNRETNLQLSYLNALVNKHLEQKEYLQYFIKIGLFLDRFNHSVSNKSDADMKNFIRYIDLEGTNNCSILVGRLLSTYDINSRTHSTRRFFSGNISVSNEELRSIEDKSNLPCIMCKITSRNGETRHNLISIFNLIATVADLSVQKDIEEYIEKNSFVRNFFLPSSTVGKNEDGVEKLDVSIESTEIDEELLNKVIAWAKKSEYINQRLKFSDLGSIWNRAEQSFREISSTVTRNKNFKEVFRLYQAAFLNALLLQCGKLKGLGDLINKSSITSDEVYIKNLNHYNIRKEISSVYTLYDFVRECPLMELDFWSVNLRFDSGFDKGKFDAKVSFENKMLNYYKTAINSGFRLYEMNRIIEMLKDKPEGTFFDLSSFRNVSESHYLQLLTAISNEYFKDGWEDRNYRRNREGLQRRKLYGTRKDDWDFIMEKQRQKRNDDQ